MAHLVGWMLDRIASPPPFLHFQLAQLLIEREPLDVDLALGLKKGGRFPQHFAGVMQSRLCVNDRAF